MSELLDLLLRWVHVIAGIMWVGNSMLFNFLDRNLRKRPEADSYGDIWLLHSGGFYLMEKNKGERTPNGLRHPEPLHWFKWQAYTTWITGALLLAIVYYWGGRALLEDATVLPMTHEEAVIKAIGGLAVGILTYEIAFRTLGQRLPAVAAIIGLGVLVMMVLFFTAHFSGRAAFIHIGAMLGTIMAGNVAFTIMPSQRELVHALREGREPSQTIADRAKTRSIHNNYITFPVIALMVSSHFPAMYAGRNAAASAFVLIFGGALVRHRMNVRFTTPSWKLWLPVSAMATIAMLSFTMNVGPTPAMHPGAGSGGILDSLNTGTLPEVTFADARRVIDRRCAACHSVTPSDTSLGRTPMGVTFDSPQQIVALVQRIKERAIVQRTMPPGNKTIMTERERAILARWIETGAKLP
jgi:uncharacterized membrane protein